MTLTPQITLTATLQDLTGTLVATTANPAKLRIALCGYGAQLPCVAGTAVIAKPGPFDIISTDGAISTLIWGNDVIAPAGTFYSITVLDGDDNVLQCGAYQFTGSGTIDLSSAPQIVPPAPPGIPQLVYRACAGAVPGTVYTAPGQVAAVAYNGVLMPQGAALPTFSYTLTGGTTINLNFTTETGDPNDRIEALCVVY